MTKIKKSIIICAITATAISGLSFWAVSAFDGTMSDNQILQIRGQCLSVKNTLNQLHSSDALLRVNRGQIYESMYTKLMDKFNYRVSSNKLNNDELKTIATEYNLALNTFRSDYQYYEEQLTKAIDIDCSAKPTQFYDAVALARTKRAQVHIDVDILNEKIDNYQVALGKFEEAFQSTVGGSN